MENADSASSKEKYPAPAYAYYVVGLLMLAYVFAFLDRMILSLLIDPMREDLSMSDTQISLLAGFAFAVCFIVFALPFGRWVDTRGRRNVIALGMALWSIATVACGLANSFWRLFFSRMLVGVGEASLTPAAYSIIPDYFPPHRRGFAMSIYACGVSVGGGLAMLLGGFLVDWATKAKPVLPLLGQIAPWKIAFIGVGFPGLLVALLVFLTMREPKRQVLETEDAAAPSIKEVITYLRTHRKLFLLTFLGFSGFAVNGYAFNVWGPSYFMRVHAFTASEVGLLFGIGFGGGGTAGILLGGLWSDRLARSGYADAPVRVGLWTSWMQAPIFIASYLCPNGLVASVLFAFAMLVASIMGGLQGTMVQMLTPNRMRGQVGALYGTTVNLVGLGFAPTLTALMTDHLFGGGTGLGYSLAVTAIVSLGASSILLYFALHPAAARAVALRTL